MTLICVPVPMITPSFSRLRAHSAHPRPSLFPKVSGRFVVRSSDADVMAALKTLGSKGRVALEEVQQEVDVISSAGKGVLLPSSWDGKFVVRSTTDLRQIEASGETTLGRMSFNMWHPNELQIQIGKVLLYKGEEDGVPNRYRIDTFFRTSNGMEGISVAVGVYNVNQDNPSRVGISFQSVELKPVPGMDDAGLAEWLATFKEANPDMDETGTLVVELPKMAEGYQGIVYMDQNVHVTLGNKDTVMMVERTDS